MLRFEWHDAKAQANLAKHGLDFVTAQLVFDDPSHISFVSNLVDDEERWTAIGSAAGEIILVVVHAYREELRNEIIRIISARHATSHERKLYEEGTR